MYNKLGEINIRDTVYLEVSPLFSTVLSMRNQGAAISVWVARLYTTLSFFPIVLFMASVLGEILKAETEMALNCGTVSFVFTLICLVLII